MRASTLPAGAGTAASSDGLALGRAAAHAGSGSPHRAWRNRNAKAEQLTDDPLVPPARVLPHEPDDELLDFVAYLRASDPTARIHPAARDQPLVPTQQRPRTHQEH